MVSGIINIDKHITGKGGIWKRAGRDLEKSSGYCQQIHCRLYQAISSSNPLLSNFPATKC